MLPPTAPGPPRRANQVLRIQVAASGVIGARLAPREALVSRVLRREAPGIYVLLFSSVDDGSADFEGQVGSAAAAGAGGAAAVPRGTCERRRQPLNPPTPLHTRQA